MLIGRFVPLVLMVLVSIIINILAFHIFVDPELLLLAIFIVILEGILIGYYKDHFKSLLESKPNETGRFLSFKLKLRSIPVYYPLAILPQIVQLAVVC